jgi:hypothetical protein
MLLPVQMRQFIRSLFLLFLRISCFLGFYIPPKFIPSEIEVYEKKKRVRFLEYQENNIIENYYVGEDIKIQPWNQNIDPIFYDRKELIKVLETKNNVLESVWNSRILYESTPRGNIVMHYDVYKDGFSYYSDQTGIPYKVLNAVAMKYVTTFRCRDFFMDETISSSPFIQYNKDDEKKEQDKKNETMKQLSSNNQNLPFVKLKNRQITTQPSDMIGTTQQQSNTNTIIKGKEYVNNRFIYKGKMQNWSPLQKPPPSKIKTESKEVLDYKTYRNSRMVVPIVESPVLQQHVRWWRMEEEDTEYQDEDEETLNSFIDKSYDVGLFCSLDR